MYAYSPLWIPWKIRKMPVEKQWAEHNKVQEYKDMVGEVIEYFDSKDLVDYIVADDKPRNIHETIKHFTNQRFPVGTMIEDF